MKFSVAVTILIPFIKDTTSGVSAQSLLDILGGPLDGTFIEDSPSDLTSTNTCTTTYEPWMRSGGSTTQCPQNGEIMTGICIPDAGGSKYQCPNGGVSNGNIYGLMQCAKNPTASGGNGLTWVNPDTSNQTIFHINAGEYGQCPNNMVIAAWVKTSQGWGFACSEVSSAANGSNQAVSLDASDTKTVCGKAGEEVSCPEGYASTKMCFGAQMTWTGKKVLYSCDTNICSGSSSDTIVGMQCTKITGYELIDPGTGTPNEGASTYDISPSNCFKYYINGVSEVTKKQSVSTTTSVSVSSSSSYQTAKTITDMTDSKEAIGLKAGIPKAEVTASASTENQQTVQVSMTTDRSYVQTQVDATTKTLELDSTSPLDPSLSYVIVQYTATTDGVANYSPVYNEFVPGGCVSQVQEDIDMTNHDLSSLN